MIRATGMNKYFHRGSVNEVHSIRDVSIDIEQGDFITIIGSNGAGKSTFLSCLAGTHALDSGTIAVDGTDVTRWPEHRRARFIGRVFQDPLMGTCAGGSIAQNMALASVSGGDSPFDQLSPRELEVGMLLVQGLRQDAIAKRLSLSAKTINTHKSRLFEKIGVHDSIALARLAARYGLMDPGSAL